MPLLEGNPHLAEVIPFPRQKFRGPSGWPALLRWLGHFRNLPHDQPEIALDFQGLLRTGLLGRIRGARPIVGLSDAREGANLLHHQAVNVDPAMHATDRYLALARAVGAVVHETALEWPLPAGRRPQRELPENFILLHPFARGEGKSLSGAALAALCHSLAPYPVILAGRSSSSCAASGSQVTSLLNETDIAELIWLLRHARVVVSVDSGPMHIAAALQPARTISIHTWSDPRLVGPYDPCARIWKAGRVMQRGELDDDEAAAPTTFEANEAKRLAETVLEMAAS